MSVQKRFKEERLRLELSQVDIADICGVKKQSVSSWEGSGQMSLDRLVELAPHGFDVQYIITGYRSGNLPPDMQPDSLNERMNRLTETQRNVIEGMLQEMEKLKAAEDKAVAAQQVGRQFAAEIHKNSSIKR